jgi:hypothetical protein
MAFQLLLNPLDAFHDVHEFAALEEVIYDIIGSPLSWSNPAHSISQSVSSRARARVSLLRVSIC